MSLQISRLINSVSFFLHFVLIIKEDDNKKFRLIVACDDKILMDKRFKSIRGARIAFFKYFKDRRYSIETKAIWSFFYEPDQNWINDILGLRLEKKKK